MISVENGEALADLLRARPGRVRLVGTNSRRDRLPPAPDDAQSISLDKLDRIERLERDDLTCSVQPGVRCDRLAESLAEQGLELGFGAENDEGTIGGLYATDPLGPANIGTPSPRSTLLGLEAVLGDGTLFRSGARVVKSVAGFDVHRLMVGSRGRLFAAVVLHLKLRPRPQASALFTTRVTAFEVALRRFIDLRSLAPPLQRLVLRSSGGGYLVEGRCTGRASFVARTIGENDLVEVENTQPDHLPIEQHEVIAGIVRPSRVDRLHALLPADAPFIVHGGGHFEAVLGATDTDRLFASLPELDAAGSVVSGARRGHNSTDDPGAERLETALRRALDPEGTFA